MKALVPAALAAVLCCSCAVVVVTGECTSHAVVLSKAKVTCVRAGTAVSVQVEGAHVSSEFMAPFTAVAGAVAAVLGRIFGVPAGAPAADQDGGDTSAGTVPL